MVEYVSIKVTLTLNYTGTKNRVKVSSTVLLFVLGVDRSVSSIVENNELH